MWRHKKEKCEHVWKLRLRSCTVKHHGSWFRKTQTFKNGTELLYICTICGYKDPIYSRLSLTEEDLVGTPQGEMIKRYKEALNEISTTHSRDNCTTGDKD